MNKTISVDLPGQPHPFRLQEDAFDTLEHYLDQARARLGDDPDADEIVADLERSIGTRLADRIAAGDRVLDAADIGAVLDEVGAVDPGAGAAAPDPLAPAGRLRRKLYRIKEGQEIAGVCSGLSAYADVRVDWVRTIFVLATLITAGFFLIVYVVLMFVLPVLPTRAAWDAAMAQGNA